MKNGRCKRHGGKAGMANKGNQHSVTHGIYSQHMTDAEKSKMAQIEQNELEQVDSELALTKIRLGRALEAEAKAKARAEEEGEELELASEVTKPLLFGGVALTGDDGSVMTIKEQRRERKDFAPIIDKLTARIESLERTRLELLQKRLEIRRLEKELGDDGENQTPLPVKVVIEVEDASRPEAE